MTIDISTNIPCLLGSKNFIRYNALLPHSLTRTNSPLNKHLKVELCLLSLTFASRSEQPEVAVVYAYSAKKETQPYRFYNTWTSLFSPHIPCHHDMTGEATEIG